MTGFLLCTVCPRESAEICSIRSISENPSYPSPGGQPRRIATTCAVLQTATRWRLADGTVYVCPPETRSEVEARFGQAAEPIDVPAANCRTCAHLSRPGLSDGLCGGERPDLPRAFGADSTHPLRERPADGGRDCLAWASRGGWI